MKNPTTEPLATMRISPEQREMIRFDPETGALDLPLSLVRELSEWVRRYDLRPRRNTRGPIIEVKQ